MPYLLNPYFISNKNPCYTYSTPILQNLHFFGIIECVYKNFFLIKILAISGTKVFRIFYLNKSLYTVKGEYVGIVLQFNTNKKYLVTLENISILYRKGLLLYIYDSSYPRLFTDSMISVYNVTKSIKYREIQLNRALSRGY